MILNLILAPSTLAPGSTCPHLPSPSCATAGRWRQFESTLYVCFMSYYSNGDYA